MRVPQSERADHERPPISIWLDNIDDDILKDFHCLVCGQVAFQYYSDVRMIIPGNDHQYMKAPTVVQCRQRMFNKAGFKVQCKTLYVIG